ncbi:siderophore iron transporter [Aspergillus luchuensis]|uniref:Siderophore iron transporter n=1 Tax=Aspergillus kawachii TaxID=1069201 RepID=A0A146FMZ1_ASPKA|nr:siderophore iron transporter [Aspergillus luchuensis]
MRCFHSMIAARGVDLDSADHHIDIILLVIPIVALPVVESHGSARRNARANRRIRVRAMIRAAGRKSTKYPAGLDR